MFGNTFGNSTFGGFGQQNTQPTSGGLFGNKSAFGNTNTSSTFGSTFGNTSGGVLSGGVLSGGGLFGSKPASSSTSLFGSSNNTTFGPSKPANNTFNNTFSSSLFGNTTSSSSGLFGNTAATFGKSTPFGSTNTNAGSTLFGFGGTQQTNGTNIKYNPLMTTDNQVIKDKTTTVQIKLHAISCMKEYENKSLDELRCEDYIAGRKTPQPGVITSNSGGGLFGSTASTNSNFSGFGNTNSSTSTGGMFGNGANLFGSTQSTNRPPGGLFGSTNSGGLFSNNTFGKTNTFSNTGTDMFGNASKPAGSLFGSTSAAANTTALFGNTPSTGTSLFGNTSNTTTSLFGNAAPKPTFGSFGNTTSLTPNTSFGNAGCTNLFTPQNKLFGSAPFGTTNTAGSLFGNTKQGLFGSTPNTTLFSINNNNNPQPVLGASLDTHHIHQVVAALSSTPYGDSPLFRTALQDHRKTKRSTPTPAAISSTKSRINSKLEQVRPKPLSCGYNQLFEGLEDDIAPSPEAFLPRHSLKKLVLQSTRNIVTKVEEQTEQDIVEPALNSEPVITVSPIRKLPFNEAEVKTEQTGKYQGDETPLILGLDGNSTALQLPFLLDRSEYYTVPCAKELYCRISHETLLVQDLIVGRTGYGEVKFLGEVDIWGLDLDNTIHFRRNEITVYPDESRKPPSGHGLNRRSEVTLECVYPVDKGTHENITNTQDIINRGFPTKLEKMTAKMGATFMEYKPETGQWTFMVKHFSQYGLLDDGSSEDQKSQAKTLKEEQCSDAADKLKLCPMDED